MTLHVFAQDALLLLFTKRYKWVPVRAEMVLVIDLALCATYSATQAVYSQGSWDGLRNEKGQWSGVIMFEALWELVCKGFIKTNWYYYYYLPVDLTKVTDLQVWSYHLWRSSLQLSEHLVQLGTTDQSTTCWKCRPHYGKTSIHSQSTKRKKDSKRIFHISHQ